MLREHHEPFRTREYRANFIHSGNQSLQRQQEQMHRTDRGEVFFVSGGDLYIQERLCIGITEDFATNLSTYLSNHYVQCYPQSGLFRLSVTPRGPSNAKDEIHHLRPLLSMYMWDSLFTVTFEPSSLNVFTNHHCNQVIIIHPIMYPERCRSINSVRSITRALLPQHTAHLHLYIKNVLAYLRP